MKIFHIMIVGVVIFFSNWAIAGENAGAGRKLKNEPYLFCNVFLADGCFGIAAGDKLTMQVVTDFVQYDVMFASGGSAHLYSGFNPNIAQADEKFKNCAWDQKFSECSIRVLNDGRTEFFARRSAKSTAIHLMFEAKVSPIIVDSFLRNIQSCTSSLKIIQCDADT